MKAKQAHGSIVWLKISWIKTAWKFTFMAAAFVNYSIRLQGNLSKRLEDTTNTVCLCSETHQWIAFKGTLQKTLRLPTILHNNSLSPAGNDWQGSSPEILRFNTHAGHRRAALNHLHTRKSFVLTSLKHVAVCWWCLWKDTPSILRCTYSIVCFRILHGMNL